MESKAVKELALPGVSKGCQASVLGKGKTLYFSGIQGIPETSEYDERAKLTLYKSEDGGRKWDNGLLLYDKLPDIAVCLSYRTDEWL